ncbi:hypothetical protein RJ640_019358 [Escallonia rubra]|uniref:F-box domain-containing protein n=1 Tax=Escallonia rubra TaxID=112253 RepID=A0AA88ULM8_9ASTE|nr:hypothetical protein RJ640_019358 [Escallonia rubra]
MQSNIPLRKHQQQEGFQPMKKAERTARHSVQQSNKKQWLSTSPTSNCVILELPWNIMSDIFFRLPFKTIATCRFVCKTWLDFISHPDFAAPYSAITPLQLMLGASIPQRTLHLVELEQVPPTHDSVHKNDEHKDEELLFSASGKRFITAKFSLSSISIAERADGKTFSRSLPRSCTTVNSCHGLLYLSEVKFCNLSVIYNPITGQYIRIPKNTGDAGSRRVSGFGFSSMSKKYKVFQLCYPSGRAWVNTIGSDSWRRSCCSTNPTEDSEYCTFIDGHVFWLSVSQKQQLDFVFSFDFETERFGRLELPPHLVKERKSGTSLMTMGELRGCLYVCNVGFRNPIDIWALKEGSAWTKELVVETCGRYRLPTMSGAYWPIKRLPDGDILMFCNIRIISQSAMVPYNVATKSSRYYKIYRVNTQLPKAPLVPIVFIPNFVSFKALMGNNVEVLNVSSSVAAPGLPSDRQPIQAVWVSCFSHVASYKNVGRH